mmetsp:Transcript_14095/g.21326  ORF Transcript_14095/g.21326 Transcript_14095/m.21326 type:complete len:172 (+) Transcript_14095:75-590(+)
MSRYTGQNIRVHMNNGNVCEGEIYTFEPERKMLILYTSGDMVASNIKRSFKVLNTNYIKKIEKKAKKNENNSVPFKDTNNLPPVQYKILEEFERQNLKKTKTMYNNKVTPAGQAIFNALATSYSVSWRGSTIVIEDDNRLEEPYRAENVTGPKEKRFREIIGKICQRLKIE